MEQEKAFPMYGVTSAVQSGMDLRDFFAAQMMEYYVQQYPGSELVTNARRAYEYADAMIKARQQ
jgi:hypothetical protein